MRRYLLLAILAGAPGLLGGCYLVRQGAGQIDILLTRQSVGDYLEGDASPADKEKIRFIQDVKQFGEREAGLDPTDNYSTFYDTEGKPVSWVVTACRKDRSASKNQKPCNCPSPWLMNFCTTGFEQVAGKVTLPVPPIR